MRYGTRGLAAAVVLAAGAVGCTTPAKQKPPDQPTMPMPAALSKPEPAKETPAPAAQPTGRNGAMNVPGTPTSGGTLRPTPANPPIDSPVLPTVAPTPAPKAEAGLPAPPPPPVGGVESKDILPPTPPKLDLPSLPPN